MIYQNNEQYEKDKARLINILIGGGVEDFAVNMFKQSKWIGCQDDNNSILSAIKACDEIVNSPADDTDWDKVIAESDVIFEQCSPLSWKRVPLQKAIEFIRAHTKH